jgi:hypothetical protein
MIVETDEFSVKSDRSWGRALKSDSSLRMMLSILSPVRDVLSDQLFEE